MHKYKDKNSGTRIKVIFLGDSAGGKTSILNKYINNRYSEGYKVPISLSRRQSASISSPRTWYIMATNTRCNFGTRPARNAFNL